MKQVGYTGSLSRIYDYVQALRQQSGSQQGLKVGGGKFSPRQGVGMLLSPKRTPEQQSLLDRLTTRNPLFARVRALTESFASLIRRSLREDARLPLDLWAKTALSSSLSSLASFARGLREDWEAVVAGLSPEWSNGSVEGAINRLKMIKRQMFGRANFDLLRRRVLPAA